MEDNIENNLDKERGERIKILRIKKDLTQEELANKIGFTKQAISKYESGEGLGYKAAKRLAEVFGVSDEYIMKGTVTLSKVTFDRVDSNDSKSDSKEVLISELKNLLSQEKAKNEFLEKENAWLKGLIEKSFGGIKG